MADQAARLEWYSSLITPINVDLRPFVLSNITTQDNQALSLHFETSSGSTPAATEANCFWLSEYRPTELISSFLKPLSAKLSISFIRRKAKAHSPLASASQSHTPSVMPQDNSSTSHHATQGCGADPIEQEDCISSSNPSNRNSALSEAQQHSPANPSTSTLSDADLEKQPLPGEPDTWKPGRSEWLVMITMAVSCLTVALDSTILVPVLPTLSLDLNGTATEAFWAGTSYLLASAVVQPFIAALSDIFGRREATLVSLTLFAVASIICAVAHNFTTLLSGRVLQGIGGGGIICQSQIVYADIVPLRQRPRYFALVLAAWAVGTMFGKSFGLFYRYTF